MKPRVSGPPGASPELGCGPTLPYLRGETPCLVFDTPSQKSPEFSVQAQEPQIQGDAPRCLRDEVFNEVRNTRCSSLTPNTPQALALISPSMRALESLPWGV